MKDIMEKIKNIFKVPTYIGKLSKKIIQFDLIHTKMFLVEKKIKSLLNEIIIFNYQFFNFRLFSKLCLGDRKQILISFFIFVLIPITQFLSTSNITWKFHENLSRIL